MASFKEGETTKLILKPLKTETPWGNNEDAVLLLQVPPLSHSGKCADVYFILK